MIPIAFYAPLKSPDHDVPSGDRTMGRLLSAALRRAGYEPILASRLRSLDIVGDPTAQADIRARAALEAERLIAAYEAAPEPLRPRLWFTYHCYYKAPDWIGPRVATALGIPYVVAEGSRSARRAQGPWAIGHAGAEAALDHADRLFVMTPHDAEDLEPALRPGQRLVSLPPFLDASAWPAGGPSVHSSVCVGAPSTALRAVPLHRCAGEEPAQPGSSPAQRGSGTVRSMVEGAPSRRENRPPLRLLTVAMMRAGDKFASYALLAEALAALRRAGDWSLDVVGDGPLRAGVEALFAPFGEAVRLRGALSGDDLGRAYRDAELFVWPAIGEAYGMTLLEAQASGCPVLAGREGGVPAVLRDGETGFLVTPRDAGAFSVALAALLDDPSPLHPMRDAAARFVRAERDLAHAADILRGALAPLVAGNRTALAGAAP